MSNVTDRLREFDLETDADRARRQRRRSDRQDARIAELEAENKRLRSETEALVSEGYPITPPAPDLAAIETQAKENYYRILYSDGCGSAKTRKAHAVWTAARTARATQDAQDATKASEGHTGIKPALAIDWRRVGPLDEDERINPNEPSYLHIPF